MLSTVLGILLSIFTPPVDYEISLAGNFGEPRPNHFHGGLDVRTEGVEGKHIYAISDGYVSRITVGKDGFGNAVYVTHPTGQTSVYCHLKSFSPRIKAALRRYQYKHQTCEADAHLTPLDVPVSQGQFIALSGNTGHSTAPHLHLEVHDTRTWNMLDPYQFLNEFIEDTVPPQIHQIMAIPQGGSKMGFAIWADDYMQGAYNHYGIHETLLYVDGQMVFHSVVDNIPVSMNRMVNSWGYYDYWARHRRWFMKSFKEPGNTLSCLQTDENRGIIDFSEPRDYHLEYVLRDFKGNETRCTFTVTGGPSVSVPSAASSASVSVPSASVSVPSASVPIPSASVSVPSASVPIVRCAAAVPQPTPLRWNRTTSISRPGLQLIIPYGSVAADTPIHPIVTRRPDDWSDACQFSISSLPLMREAELTLYAPPPFTTFDPSKLYITDENARYMGGDFHDGWVTGHIRELSSRYEVAYDDQPPTVNPITLTGDVLRLSVTDGKSGISKWTATIDDRFIVFDAIEKSTTYACFLRESWLRRSGTQHRLHFEVTDHRQNTAVFDTTFTY